MLPGLLLKGRRLYKHRLKTKRNLQLPDDNCVQLFYVVTEPYVTYNGKDMKDLRRWAYEIYSSFLDDRAVSFPAVTYDFANPPVCEHSSISV